jgi:hypothetical protein
MNNFRHYILFILFIIISFFIVSCSGNEGGNMGNNVSKGIEFLGRSDCIHSPAMEKNFVSALETSGVDKKYKYIDLASLPAGDYRRGYGTPTILINGEDLFGMPKPMPITSAPT